MGWIECLGGDHSKQSNLSHVFTLILFVHCFFLDFILLCMHFWPFHGWKWNGMCFSQCNMKQKHNMTKPIDKFSNLKGHDWFIHSPKSKFNRVCCLPWAFFVGDVPARGPPARRARYRALWRKASSRHPIRPGSCLSRTRFHVLLYMVVCTYVCMDGWMDACVHVWMFACMHACLHVTLCACMRVCRCAWMPVCMDARMYYPLIFRVPNEGPHVPILGDMSYTVAGILYTF